MVARAAYADKAEMEANPNAVKFNCVQRESPALHLRVYS
jgi:hypothetical protein